MTAGPIDLATHPFTSPLLQELQWRGLIHQITDPVGLDSHLSDASKAPRSIYAGFDPTSDSLTIGNLVPMMMLLHVARHGHRAVAVQGGATGLIGDPSGKTAERQLQTPETVQARVDAQKPIFGRVWSNARVRENSAIADPTILNNMDWIGRLSWIEALRDIGKHFSVNMMIQKDAVRERLNSRDQGISYTEFSYMLLQAYDFLHLHSKWFEHGLAGPVSVQMGGSDQYGNIVTGMDFIRRTHTPDDSTLVPRTTHHSPSSFGLTAPLVTKSDGTKFGKTESGAIWLSARSGPHDTSSARTSPYAYYQFWLNALDADAVRYLKIYTLLTRDEIDALAAAHAANPGAREAHRTLAREATLLLHGRAAMEMAEKAAGALFSGDIAGLDAETLAEALAGAPSSTLPRARLDGPGIPFIDLLVETGLAKSKREAREFLESGSVQASGRKVGPADAALPQLLLHGTLLPIRRGKKTWHVVRWE